jgi:hypothetical protein
MSIRFSTIANAFAVAAITALAFGSASTAKAENKKCSVASLEGSFAYTSTGFIVAAPYPPIIGPYAEVGTQTFDGKGGVTFTFNASINGNVGPATATGSYTVNEDCTGTFTEATSGFTSNFSFVIDDSNEFRAICQDAGAVVTRAGQKRNTKQ